MEATKHSHPPQPFAYPPNEGLTDLQRAILHEGPFPCNAGNVLRSMANEAQKRSLEEFANSCTSKLRELANEDREVIQSLNKMVESLERELACERRFSLLLVCLLVLMALLPLLR